MSLRIGGFWVRVERRVPVVELDVRLAARVSVVLRSGEARAVLRHRRFGGFCALCWVLTFPLFYRPDAEVGLWRQAGAHLLMQGAALGLVLCGLVAVARMRRGRVVVRVAVPIAVAAGGTVAVGQWLGQGLGWVVPVGPGWVAVQACIAAMAGAAQAAVFVARVIPSVLEEVRARGPVCTGETVAMLSVGRERVALHMVLHVRAEGNYVQVTRRDGGRLFVLATLRSVVAQMPDGEGMLIHRSLWIAAAAFAGYRREGADLFVRSVDGREFKVARSRHREVLPWLKERTAEMGRQQRGARAGAPRSGLSA